MIHGDIAPTSLRGETSLASRPVRSMLAPGLSSMLRWSVTASPRDRPGTKSSGPPSSLRARARSCAGTRRADRRCPGRATGTPRRRTPDRMPGVELRADLVQRTGSPALRFAAGTAPLAAAWFEQDELLGLGTAPRCAGRG